MQYGADGQTQMIVLQSGVPVRMVTLNATHSAELSMEDADKLISLGTPAGRLAGSLIYTRGEAAKALGWHDGSHEAIHDALAVAAVIDPSVLTDIRRQPCDIDISGGAADGVLLVEYRNQNDPACPVQIAYAADKEKFFAMLEKHFRAGNH